MPANFKTGGTIPTPEEKNQPQADEIDRFDVFLKWLDDGKCNYADLYLHYYDEDYRGIHIKQDLPARKVILSIPKTHIMTTDMAKRSKVGRQLRKPGLYLSCTDSYLAMYLLAERSNPSSFWRPFIDILPKKYSTMPIFFTDDELTWLKGSFALDKIATRKRELRREYDEIVNHVEDFKRFTYEDFVWARVVIITRYA